MSTSTPGRRLLFESKVGRLQADAGGFLRIDWSSEPRTLAELQHFCEQIVQALKHHSWARALGNQAHMRPFTAEEQQWIAREWLPRVVREGGYRFGALVVSADVLVRLATAYVTTNVQGLPLTYRSFETEAAALQWLAQQPERP